MQDFRFLHGCQLRALLAPLIVGTIGQEYNYHLGFSLAAIGMFFGLLQYIIQGRKTLDGVGTTPPNPLTTEERKGFIRNLIIALVVIAAVFGGAQLTGHLTIDFLSIQSVYWGLSYRCITLSKC